MLPQKSHLLIFTLVSAFCTALAETCGQTDKPPSPTSECCGLDLADDHRKTSGDAAINQFPWLALIEANGRPTCTGVIISSRYVLTAAQCLYQSPTNVRLGEFNKTNSGPDCLMVGGKKICNGGAITIAIEATASHAHYNQDYHGHDIAILKLAKPVPYNEFIRPICLPTSDITVSPPENLRLINAGWGSKPSSDQEEDVVKHYVELPYVPLKRCKEIYKDISHRYSSTISEKHICAGGEKGLDSCRGDGGGPLMFEEGGRYSLAGIVSFGAVPCGRVGVPSVYTKVFYYLPWINNVTSTL
ncbi:phenoloxidase-activating enzyme-like isoform X2 [Melitaea cinxia]|uniref:phenoloxidase-activating enzyme-like isoform X2 n=1 Tax=Melitaea cinxia TaxID=113334 RepID=UPI001E27116E|nr:phenoloxidase-activating enzyme-like isoform X2 [Melitaea cinxia]